MTALLHNFIDSNLQHSKPRILSFIVLSKLFYLFCKTEKYKTEPILASWSLFKISLEAHYGETWILVAWSALIDCCSSVFESSPAAHLRTHSAYLDAHLLLIQVLILLSLHIWELHFLYRYFAGFLAE